MSKIKKTIFIWQEDFFDVKYLVLKGDYSHLNGVYINACEDESLNNELDNLMYDDEGTTKHKDELLDKFPLDEVNPKVAVIACGLYP